MKKLLTVTLTLLILLTLSSCKKKEEVPLFNEESLSLIEKYNGKNFGKDYDIAVQEYDPNTDKTYTYSYYDILARPSSMFKLMDAQTFMDIVLAEKELSQMFILIGEKTDNKTYKVLEQIQKATENSGIVTFFINADDIRNNEQIANWFHERFNYNEIALNEYGYKKSQITDTLIPTPIIINWWNQVIYDIQVIGPNFWSTNDIVERICVPITEEDKEYYPLGCEQIKYDLGGII